MFTQCVRVLFSQSSTAWAIVKHFSDVFWPIYM